jgi:hypothetical protein
MVASAFCGVGVCSTPTGQAGYAATPARREPDHGAGKPATPGQPPTREARGCEGDRQGRKGKSKVQAKGKEPVQGTSQTKAMQKNRSRPKEPK